MTNDILLNPGVPALKEEPTTLGAVTRETQKDLLRWFQYAPVRMPRTQAELFHFLALLTPQIGLTDFLRMTDFTNVNPIQIYHLGLWFNSPQDVVKAGGPPNVTPFNGEHDAGVQVLNTGEFAPTDGQLKRVTTSGN